jgi:uncharacterized protein with ATP-grasp and redox domains
MYHSLVCPTDYSKMLQTIIQDLRELEPNYNEQIRRRRLLAIVANVVDYSHWIYEHAFPASS